MVVRLTDIFDPEIYAGYFSINSIETNAFVQAGVAVNNEFLNAIAGQSGQEVTVPFWNDIDPTIEPNYSNDDPSDLSVSQKINSGSMKARKSYLNQSFGAMDLARELSSQDPLEQIKSRFDNYWRSVMSRRLIATCKGVMTDSVVNHASDMVLDISGQAGPLAIFNAGSYIDAAYTMGDQVGQLGAIAVHSAIEARMVKNDEIQFIQDSDGNIVRKTYKGATIIVDDTLPTSGSGATRAYTSIMFGTGAVGFGSQDGTVMGIGVGSPEVAAEVFRTFNAGNGGGMEEIIERKTWMLQPLGYSWDDLEGTGNALAEYSPTYADLAVSAHWTRKVPRKNIPLAFLISQA